MWKILLLNFLLLTFLSCETQKPPKSTFNGIAMTMPYSITVGHPLDEEEKYLIQETIDKTFEQINIIYNNWNPNSEISKLNSLPANKRIKLSRELYEIFQLTDYIHTLSAGRFDPTVEPLKKLWLSYMENHTLPPKESIEETLSYCGWNHIHFDNGSFYKDHSFTHIDLGGIAKGLCVDLLTEAIQNIGYQNILVDWGSELKAHGEHPEKRPWMIAIRHPYQAEQALAHIPLQDEAIATSGDYMQQWEVIIDETHSQVFTHIINPFTGCPLSNQAVKSASVQAPTCALADGLATAAMIFETAEEAQDWAQKLQNENHQLSFWLLSPDE